MPGKHRFLLLHIDLQKRIILFHSFMTLHHILVDRLQIKMRNEVFPAYESQWLGNSNLERRFRLELVWHSSNKVLGVATPTETFVDYVVVRDYHSFT